MKEATTTASDAHASSRGAIIGVVVAICLFGFQGVKAMSIEGLISIKSNYGPEETMERLEAAIKATGMTVFARIDHAAAAAAAGMKLRPTNLLIFGSAKGGTPLMQTVQTIGIDLPLKALIWQDEAGATWISYNDLIWLAKRHRAETKSKAAIHAMLITLDAVVSTATTARVAPN
ncbi:uncharacterized protein (DUF302 family) [Bradyrhizobium japonicum]